MTRVPAIVAAALLLACAARASAQETIEPRVTAEAVASASMLSGNQHVGGMLDVTGTLRLGGGAMLIARPWTWRRPDGTSTFQWYQLQVRYQSRTRTPVRVDAGVITSPLGLNPLQQRADLNPTISPVSYYVVPLPRFEPRFESLQPLTSGYPLGIVVSTSGMRWDLRGGMIDSTPARPGVVLKDDPYPSLPQVVLGGGVTLHPGLRVGAGFGHGRYRKASSTEVDGDATVANVEAEYTVNHTRLSGEWVTDWFSGSTGDVVAKSFYIQGVQTITPRLFAAARVTHVSAPVVFGLNRAADWDGTEVTGGFRVTPHVTARGGYYRQKPYSGISRNIAEVSIVLDGRWWK